MKMKLFFNNCLIMNRYIRGFPRHHRPELIFIVIFNFNLDKVKMSLQRQVQAQSQHILGQEVSTNQKSRSIMDVEIYRAGLESHQKSKRRKSEFEVDFLQQINYCTAKLLISMTHRLFLTHLITHPFCPFLIDIR